MSCVVSIKTTVGVPAIKGECMKIEELKALIDSYTSDGEINHDELNKAVNAKFDALIDLKVSKAKESGKAETIAEFITEQGFENLDQFTASVKNTKATASELSEKVTRYEQELQALQSENVTLKTANDDYSFMGKLSDVDEKYRKYALSEIRGLMQKGEIDFDAAKSTFVESNPQFGKQGTEIVTRVPQNNTTNQQSDGVLAILEKKSGIKLE